jgi:uncharacterized glyoxalase superfamily protein PhnB
MARFLTITPVLPTGDFDEAVSRFRKLGFTVTMYDAEPGAQYGYASRDGVELHISPAGTIDPGISNVVVYAVVEDPDALYEEWQAAGVPGRLRKPAPTGYGAREGGYVDPDGNLIRFASTIE